MYSMEISVKLQNVCEYISGSIFGALAVMENICFLVGTVSAGAIYSATVTFYKGFVFFVMAGFIGVAMILLM